MASQTRRYAVVATVPWIGNGQPFTKTFAYTYDDAIQAQVPTEAVISAEAKRLISFNDDAAATWDAAKLGSILEAGDIRIDFIQELQTLLSPYATAYLVAGGASVVTPPQFASLKGVAVAADAVSITGGTAANVVGAGAVANAVIDVLIGGAVWAQGVADGTGAYDIAIPGVVVTAASMSTRQRVGAAISAAGTAVTVTVT
jgi:hypothetical protein